MSRTSYLRRPLTALLMGAALAVSLVMAVVVLASPAWAATYTVNNTNDAGEGSLRQAIIDADANTGVADTINFNLGSPATITLTSSQLPDITDEAGLTIDGGSAGITISGDNQYRVFEVGSGAKLTLSNLTVADSGSDAPDGGGGAILNVGGTLEVINSTLSGNSAPNGGGAILNAEGTVTVSNSTLSGNSVSNGYGGGISNNYGTVTVSNSTLSGNSADNGGGGAIFNAEGMVTVSNSTLSGNSAPTSTNADYLGYGGAIYNSAGRLGTLEVINSTLSGNSAPNGGGGIYNTDGTLEVINSTLSGNSVSNGRGGGINFYGGTLEVINSTLSGNSAPNGGGGGISNTGGSTVTLKNTIVANSPSASGGSCYGAIANGGYNLDSDNTCGFSTNNNSLSGVAPMLGPLADNGGPTMTHALLAGSPAIDQGNSFEATTDQRGLPRPIDFVGIVNASGGDGSDIGAFERQLQEPDTTPPTVISTVPANGGEVAPTANVKATFSEDMLSASVENAFKLFKKGSTTKIAAAVTYEAETDTAKLNPTNNLKRGATYKAVVSTVAKDEASNRLDQDGSAAGLQQKVWFFEIDN